MTEFDVIRKFPSFIPLPFKTKRIPEKTFTDYFKWKEHMLTNVNYIKFINQINPITGRRMKKDGRTYLYTERKFRFYIFNGIDMKYEFTMISEMSTEDIESYIKETKRIEQDWVKVCNIIAKHNEQISEIVRRIELLKDWNDYILYNGVKYGLPPFYNGIHYENSCMGKVIEHDYIPCSCHSCENWSGSNCRRGGAQIYKCIKCNKDHIVSHSKIAYF